MSAATRRLAIVGLTLAMSVGPTTIAASTAQAHGHHVSIDRTAVFEVGDESAVTGRSTLLRTRRGALGFVRTGGLQAGDAYTVWAVVFNNPAGCIDGCDGADLANPAAEAVSMLGAGKVAQRSAASFLIRIGAGDELTDPHGAEIHFVLRTHGPALPGLVDEQISSLNGGCPPNECANVLMAKHD
ncbi:MAG: hypothetical protein HKN41_02120 [Ilumatobacter sp.]|nr:hypothetical protein [Ilumatobacter sp.]